MSIRGYTDRVAARTRFQLAATLPLEVLDRRPVPHFTFPYRLLAILGLLPLLLIFSILAAYRQQQADRIYSGVRIFGVDVSRMTRDEATGALRKHLTEVGRKRFALRFDDDAVLVSLTSLGLSVDEADLAPLVDRAWLVGRDDNLSQWLRDQVTLLRHGFDVPAQARIDRDRAATTLNGLAPEVERVTVNASISVERAGDRFEVHTSPAQTGRRLNIAATLDRLERSMVGTLPESVDLVLEQAPPVLTDTHLETARAAIQTLLGSPFEFRDGARQWRLEPAEAFEMLEITGMRELTPPVSARLNPEKLSEFVRKTVRLADLPAQNPTFALEGDQVVVRPGRPGKLADADKTVALVQERLQSGEARSADIVFTPDLPWISEADLEPSRVLANAQLDLPITLETPSLPNVVERKWTLGRAELASMVVLPTTQNTPRDLASLPPAQRPRYELSLDASRMRALLTSELEATVSEPAVDAELQMSVSRVTSPAGAAATGPVDASQAAPGQPSTVATGAPAPATAGENRYTVGLRNARSGRGPDYEATYNAVLAIFRSPQITDPAERRVTVRVSPRAPRVSDLDLALARDQANGLIGEPIQLRWQDQTWTVSRDELADMLRYQPGRDGKLTAYLTRDGLLAKAGAIARELERGTTAPRGRDGQVLPLDIPATAGAIWEMASTRVSGRVTAVVWAEDLSEDPDAPPPAPATPRFSTGLSVTGPSVGTITPDQILRQPAAP